MLKGEPYLVGEWFSFQKETTKFAWISPQSEGKKKRKVICEVFSTQLQLNDKHQMDIGDYRMLICSVNY